MNVVEYNLMIIASSQRSFMKLNYGTPEPLIVDYQDIHKQSKEMKVPEQDISRTKLFHYKLEKICYKSIPNRI